MMSGCFGGSDRINIHVGFLQITQSKASFTLVILAEATGFEPANELPRYTLSKRAPSTTRPHFRIVLF